MSTQATPEARHLAAFALAYLLLTVALTGALLPVSTFAAWATLGALTLPVAMTTAIAAVIVRH